MIHFLYKWGWERLILMMAKALNADLASWFLVKVVLTWEKNDLSEKW